MITTTLGELATAYDGLKAVLSLPLPARTSFHAAKLARLIMGDVQSFNQERDALVRKFGAPKEGSETEFSIPVERIAPLNAEVKELADTVANVDYDPLTLDMLDGHNIAGEHLIALGPLLKENAA